MLPRCLFGMRRWLWQMSFVCWSLIPRTGIYNPHLWNSCRSNSANAFDDRTFHAWGETIFAAKNIASSALNCDCTTLVGWHQPPTDEQMRVNKMFSILSVCPGFVWLYLFSFPNERTERHSSAKWNEISFAIRCANEVCFSFIAFTHSILHFVIFFFAFLTIQRRGIDCILTFDAD